MKSPFHPKTRSLECAKKKTATEMGLKNFGISCEILITISLSKEWQNMSVVVRVDDISHNKINDLSRDE